jgi:hypothetical protein
MVQFLLFIIIVSVFSIRSSNVGAIGTESGVGFYNIKSLPAGMKSIDPLLDNYWNWWAKQSPAYSQNWPSCMIGQAGKLGSNQSIVFFGDPATAVETNVNAKNQNCQISSNQAIFFPPYNGLCNTGEERGETPAQLLQCAIGTNKGIKIMNLKIDGNDVSNAIFHTNTSKPFIWDVPKDNVYAFPASNPNVGRHPAMAEGYYVFIKPLPLGTHKIELEVLRNPQEPNQPIEHPIVKYTVNVVPPK